MVWNPDQYLKFSQPRLRPALDLLARIALGQPRDVYDLGCGTGNITHLLAQRWPEARVTGIDDSPAMLAAARESGRIRWEQRSIAGWMPQVPADLIFSNSALHWLPEHEVLLPALAKALAPGGVLAIQMPRNFLAPSHTEIYETVRAGPWRDALERFIVPPPAHDPRFYHAVLSGHTAELDIWETEYLHVLEGKDAVKEWTKGSWLKRFLDALEEPQRSAFEAEYARRVAIAYPPGADGRTLFPFRRLFIVLTR